MEAVAYSLQIHPDSALEAIADNVIELVGKAQQPDGYLNSFFAINGQRWTNLHECHELYIAGHFIEAGVAWFEATGKRKLLDIVLRLADCIERIFGPDEDKLHGYDGHQEVELALVRLYSVTGGRVPESCPLFFGRTRKESILFYHRVGKKRENITLDGHCIEEIDNGANLSGISIPSSTQLSIGWDKSILGGTWAIQCEGIRDNTEEWGDVLYRPLGKTKKPLRLTAVPYSQWGNRQPGEMAVWIRKE